MGNDLQTVYAADTLIIRDKPLKEQFTSLGKRLHAYIGEIDLYRHNQSGLLVFSKMYANEWTDNEMQTLRLHEDRKLLQHPNLIRYLGLALHEHTFKNVGESHWHFEHLDTTLANVVMSHKAHLLRIHEKELWKVLKELVSVCAYLENHNISHSYLQTDQIYIDKNQATKIAEKGILRFHSGYAECIKEGRSALLSPQLIHELRMNNTHPIHDIHKSDVFSLGMVFLELMTLKNSSECYQFGQYPCILDKVIEERLSLAYELGYSEELLNVIKNMLLEQEEQRPSFKQLNQSEELDYYDRVKANKSYQSPTKPLTYHADVQPTIQAVSKFVHSPQIVYQQPIQYVIQSAPPKQEIQYTTQQYTAQQLEYFRQQQYIHQQQLLQQQQLVQPTIVASKQITTSNNISPNQTPIKSLYDEYHNNWALSQRVSQALANSRYNLDKYGYQ